MIFGRLVLAKKDVFFKLMRMLLDLYVAMLILTGLLLKLFVRICDLFSITVVSEFMNVWTLLDLLG